MTLKEKFDDVEFNEYGINTVKCEKIAEEFAIGFADWIRVCKLKGRSYDFDNIKELLTIYKEEKGL
jgi:hypothetical protein